MLGRLLAIFGAISEYLLDNWEPVLAYLTGLGGLVAYFLTRRSAQAWNRTQFLFQQAQYLDNDPELAEVIDILEGRHSALTVDLVFDQKPALDGQLRASTLRKFDKLLNFIERLAYSVTDAKTLSKKEITSFGWYIDKAIQHPLVVAYCEDNGYHDVLSFAKMLGLRAAARPDPAVMGSGPAMPDV